MATDIVPPAVDAANDQPGKKHQYPENVSDGNPEGCLGNTFFRFMSLLLLEELGVGIVRQIVFGEKRFLVEAKITGDGADKAAIENTAWEFLPIFVFQCLQESWTDARGLSKLFHRHFAQFAFAF